LNTVSNSYFNNGSAGNLLNKLPGKVTFYMFVTKGDNLDNFFLQLPRMPSFAEVFNESFYQEVPADWWIVMTDVVGSTMAIEAGRYKDVNSAGSLSAMVISNYFGNMKFPFIFGGDGMTCLIPGSAEPAIRNLLCAVPPLVKKAFDLDLRVALVPVQVVIKAGRQLWLARWDVSLHYSQAIVDGDGLDYAENLMKGAGSAYLVESGESGGDEPDFSGYSCRWQDYPSQRDETIALIVKFRVRQRKYLQDFVQLVDRLIGAPSDHHPLTVQSARISLSSQVLGQEAAVVLGSNRGLRAFFYRQWVRFQIIVFLVFERLHLPLKTGQKVIGDARQENVLSSDYRKYDNSLKMVVAVTKDMRQRLTKLLENQFTKGRLFYGLHVSNRAMLTCLMHARSGHEVHFVDAADGGYAFAARQIKRQIASSATS